MSTTDYPTIQFRAHAQEKADFLELAAIRGTTISAMLKTFMQGELASLPRERRIATPKPETDFLS